MTSAVRMQIEILVSSSMKRLCFKSKLQPFARRHFSTFDKLPVVQDFYLTKVSKHLCMHLSSVYLIIIIIIHGRILSKNFRGPKLCCTTYHEREKRENVTTPPRCHENFTGSRLTNALSLKFCFSPNIALHLVAAFYIQDLLTRNFRSSSSNLLAGNVEFSNLKTYRVCSFGMIRIESLSRVDSSVHLIYHDPSDLGSLIPIRIISKERTQVTVRSQSVLQNI